MTRKEKAVALGVVLFWLAVMLAVQVVMLNDMIGRQLSR